MQIYRKHDAFLTKEPFNIATIAGIFFECYDNEEVWHIAGPKEQHPFIEVALLFKGMEATYPGYERVKIFRKPENFKLVVGGCRDRDIIIKFVDDITFPQCKGKPTLFDHVCKKVCGHGEVVSPFTGEVFNQFALFLNNRLLIMGDLIPTIEIYPDFFPRLRNTSAIRFNP